MNCPKCHSNMALINYNGVEIDRCENCQGLWFDKLEREDLKKLKGAESVDIGDEFTGAKYDQIRNISCPKCGTDMRHVVSTEPFEIGFESCPGCQGSFFDAGEFRDYMEDEIYDQFKDLLDLIE